MKTTITLSFDDAAAAAAFLAKVTGQPVEPVVTAAAGEGVTVSPSPAAPVTSGRKPRSDAGKPRGAYKPRESSAVAGEGANGEASSAPAAEPASPAVVEPQTSSAPTSNGGDQKDVTPASASAAEEDFPATLDGVRKAGKALSSTKGKGMDASLASLKEFKVVRITDLKPEQYGPIIKYMLDQCSPEGIEAAKKWAEEQKRGGAK